MALHQITALNSTPFALHFAPIRSSEIQSQRRPPQLRFRVVACVSTAKTKPPRRKPSPDAEKAEAEELVRVMVRSFTEKEPLSKTLNKYVRLVRTQHCFMLFEELGRKGKWLQCLEVFRWMQKQRWYVADNGVYSKLISVMGKHGQIRMAMWLFSEMRNSGCRPDTSVYNSLISAHLHSRDKAKALAKALGYFERMKGLERCQPNVVTYNILLRACAQAREVDQVNALLKELESSNVSPDVYTYNGVMDAYGKNGMISEMESLLTLMKSDRCKPDIITFNLLIDSYGRKQQFAKMEQVFKSLLSHPKEKPTLPTFNSMITSYGKARQRERAESVFEKMTVEMKYTPSFITFESMITMYGFCDCMSNAREIFDSMVGSGKEIRVSTLNAMLSVYCMNKLHSEAQLLLENVGGLGVRPDSSTYKLLYKAYTKANQKELVERLLKRMERDGVVPNKKFFLDALGSSKSSAEGSESNRRSTNSQNATKSLKTAASPYFSKLASSPSKAIHPRKEDKKEIKDIDIVV
ncbi:unnamed protein product [Linum tenue]|uniref:Pentatricopeptide repeat-containing protein n=1 Tax=Linum tenue TaxID=586396 RepID=A0AAV0RDR6_9ROSI|nr:unnamed protein product [Linum tenue]